MATKAKTTKGIKLQRGDGAAEDEEFTTIAEVTNFSGPPETAESIEASSFDSEAKEFVAGLSDGGEFTFDCNFIGSDAEQQGLRADSRSGVLRNFRLVFNDHATAPTQVEFSAVVTSPPTPTGAVNAVITASCSLKVSGLPVWTYALSA